MSTLKQKIEAVFFDVDGTLLSHKTHGIPQSTVDALRSLQSRGILTVIATGRHMQELSVLPVDQIRYDGYIILNGQLCLDADRRPCFGSPITGPDRDCLVRMFLEREMPVILVDREGLYLNYADEYVRRVQTMIPASVPEEGGFPGDEIYMGCLFGPRELDRERESRFDGLKLVRWHDYAADIIPVEGGKAAGIRRYLEKQQIDSSRIMAFGDEENDLEMLRYARIGVAMGNASPLAKEAADFVTDDIDEDGVANALRHFGLI